MKTTRSIATVIFAASALAVGSLAQDNTPAPPRMVGSFAVNNATSAPLQVVKSVSLDAGNSEVFTALTTHENWPKWIAGLALSSVKGSGENTVREFSMGDALIKERFLGYEENALLAYSIAPGNPFGLENHLGVFLLSEDGSHTVLEWHQFFDHPAPEVVGEKLAGMMSGVFEKMIGTMGGMHRGSAVGSDTVKIVSTRVVDAPKKKVWDAAANGFSNVSEWASVVIHSEKSGPIEVTGVGAGRSCETAFGSLKETVLTFDEVAGTFRPFLKSFCAYSL